jgi:Fe-Mn family superoxide dismutase
MFGVYPILVIDMWDHALYKDYLDDRQSYLIAQMREINWQIVEERIKKSEKIAEVIK